uniref:Troponin I n=1 Tax=Plectus sambesii TaxID=2011161 RepID=A0A914XIR9_9BILA
MCEFISNRNEMVELGQDDEVEQASVPELENQLRYGGCQADEDDASRKAEERERKKAEVRKRLEEAGRAKKAKKGFLTPERKKKLRKLLMMKAAEDLKQQQLLKEQERQRILQERIIALPNVDSIDDQGKLSQIYKEMMDRIIKLEADKYDVNYSVRQKDFEINELTIAVNDLRGKFVKPTLKKVSKYDNKFKKMQDEKKGDKADFRSNLKVVKKENAIEELMNVKKKSDKPEWSKKGGAAEEGEEKPVKAPKEKVDKGDDDAEPESVAESVPAEEPEAEAAADEEEEE